jgi:hypothetical protein
VLAIPFGGATLPGYASGTPRPTLLMLGSGDTVVEDLYAYIGPTGLRRSYNAHMVDLPGQGPAVAGLVMRPDAKVPMRTVARWAARLRLQRLAAYGTSGGGSP